MNPIFSGFQKMDIEHYSTQPTICSVKMSKINLNTKIINISYLFICSIIWSFISDIKVRSYEAI